MTSQSPYGEKLVPINGPAGPFEIAFAGLNRDQECNYRYRDKAHDFYFSAEVTPRPFWNIKILSAVTAPLRSTVYKVSADDERSLRANIEFFFKTRADIQPAEELKPGTVVVVSFEWRIVR
jgi:hypothetical protein